MAEQSLEEVYRGMNSAQKAALLLIALGQRWATEVMRVLKPEEVKTISYWISQMSYVPQQLTEKIIRDFYERLVRKTSLASSGGRDYLLDVLSGMMGETKANELVEDISSQEETDVFRVLRKVEPRQLGAYLKQEQPQTIALLLSYLDPTRAAAVISEFESEVRFDVMLRLAKLEETDPEVVAAMEQTLSKSLGTIASRKEVKKVGGPKVVAEILNNLDRYVEKEIMEQMTDKDFDLANEVKNLMFVFADVILLDDKSVQALLKEIDQSDLVLCLKGTSEGVKDKVFRNISKRQAETINDELSFMGPVKASVVQEAQQKVVNIIRKLDEEGKILIQGKGGGDEVIS